MSKKKIRAFVGAMVVVLAFVPFLGGCVINDAASDPQAARELEYDEQQREEVEGSIGQDEGMDDAVGFDTVEHLDGEKVSVVVVRDGNPAFYLEPGIGDICSHIGADRASSIGCL